MTQRKLVALTLIQPWAWCVAHAGKLVENRTWKPPAHLIGGYLAIHAGKKLDRETILELREDGVDVPATVELGAIVAVARVAGWVKDNGAFIDSRREVTARAGVSQARAEEIIRSRWWAGPIGWVLEDVVAIDPVPALGSQGLWTVETAAADMVRTRWKEARAA